MLPCHRVACFLLSLASAAHHDNPLTKTTLVTDSLKTIRFQKTTLPPVTFDHLDIDNFEDFVAAFNISFKNSQEEIARKDIFDVNLAEMQAYNLVHDIKQGVNIFSSLTYEEIIAHHTGATITDEKLEMFRQLEEFQQTTRETPVRFDWRSVAGAVTAVRNQGGCGSCWAHAAAAAIETHQFLRSWRTVDLSVQAILDCTYSASYDGCDGGWGLIAYRENPLQYTEASYPYTGRGDAACRTQDTDPDIEVASSLSGYMKVQSWNAVAMQQALVEEGPLDVSFHVADGFHSWDWNHVYRSDSCNLNWPDHEVVIVGYGEEADGTKFWTVKNSWGPHWGLDGYFRIARGENMCNIELLPIFPTIPAGPAASPGRPACAGATLAEFPSGGQQACQHACAAEPLCAGWSLRTSDHWCRLEGGHCTACRGDRCHRGLFVGGTRD